MMESCKFGLDTAMSIAGCSGVRPIDVIKFGPDRRRTLAGMIGKQPALAFIPNEAQKNSARAANTEAEREGAEEHKKAHGVPPFSIPSDSGGHSFIASKTSAARTAAIGLDGGSGSAAQSGFHLSVELNATKLALWALDKITTATILKLTKLTMVSGLAKVRITLVSPR